MQARPKIDRFPSFARERINHALSEISSVLNGVSYRYTDDTLIVYGLTADGKEVTFTHGNSATSGLELFMDGYNAGYGHGVEDQGKR